MDMVAVQTVVKAIQTMLLTILAVLSVLATESTLFQQTKKEYYELKNRKFCSKIN